MDGSIRYVYGRRGQPFRIRPLVIEFEGQTMLEKVVPRI